ncbi:hypothetical protein NGF19_15370 [Streptomyces sp. RY43-2]|uniref:Protein kinase domain-containing protein n=1 Tax=Streptomyces macrolidinus TaxID=2952607 RepID=A0ABT0ZEZ0_9ACTN|nr:hypothetical protein [Streptomyces macrolidinus]MCN9242153.1 hypothetical protein [Streptomyces macrolidinus]
MKRWAGNHTKAVGTSRFGKRLRKETGTLVERPTPGLSLAEIVDAVGALPEESVLRIAAGLAVALSGLHRTGLAHGNIQLASVLLTRSGPRLADSDADRALGTGDSARPPGQTGRPYEPSADMVALGLLLVTAYTGRAGSGEPDISTLPVRLRQVVAVCLADEPGDPPTTVRLLDAIGPLVPAPRTWPPEVDELIARRQVDSPQLTAGAEALTSTPVDAPPVRADLTDTTPPPVPPTGTESLPPRRTWPRRAALLGAVAVVSSIVTALVITVPHHDSDPDTDIAEAPPSIQPTTSEPTRETPPSEAPRQPAPDPEQNQDEDRSQDEDQVTEQETAADQEPTSATTRQTRQPGAIADCQGKPLSEPTMLLVACGDGAATLLDMTWTAWGEPSATARGVLAEVVCEPSCANGHEVRVPATVTVSGLVGGRYTLMDVSAPTSPVSPFAHYTLDAMGPTRRS